MKKQDMPDFQWQALRFLIKTHGVESVIGAIRTIEAELAKENKNA